MFDRSCLGALLLIALALPIAGCGKATGIDSIQVTPATQSVNVGNKAQFTATGIIDHGTHPPTTEDVTNQVTWSSSANSVATINSAGLATAVGAGSTTITATMPGFTGTVSGSATLAVQGSGGGGTGGALVSISIIPSTQSVASPTETSQFIAIGTTSSGATENITNQVVWSSSSKQIATISAGGLATAVSQGTTTITAIATNSGGSVVTGTATFTVENGVTEQVTALTIYPASQAATAQTQQSQFFVLGAEGGGLQYDLTKQVVWTSSNKTVATIGTAGDGMPGQATAVSTGTTTITATWTNKDGSKVVATATYSVTLGSPQEPLISIKIVPDGITVTNEGMTGQFLAFGTYSTTPTVRDLTNSVTWISTSPEIASITSGGVPGETAGLATALGYTGQSVLYAEQSNPDGTVVLSNPQDFVCKDPLSGVCDQVLATPQFSTLTVYNAGENTTTWLVSAPSDTGIPNLIHCGPGWKGAGGSVCTGTYETGYTVTLTESPVGNGFGGWSTGDGVPGAGCVYAPGKNAITSPTCTITLIGNSSVGAIFY